MASLFGLASGGVYRAATVTSHAVRSYRTFSPLPDPGLRQAIGGMFSVALAVNSVTGTPQALPGTLPCEARTFLHARRHSDCLAGSHRPLWPHRPPPVAYFAENEHYSV